MTVPALDEAAGLEAPAGPTRFPALDGLRGLAALAVVTTHVGFQTGRTRFPGPVAALLSRMDYGVAVFFLLSGFLLYRPFVDGTRRLGTYAKRRALRVLPVYYVAVVAALVLLPRNDGTSAAQWVEHVLLLQIYLEPGLPDGLTQMWSLCTEVAFYVALPVLALGLLRARARGVPQLVGLAVLGAVGVVVTGLAATAGAPQGSNLWLPSYLDWFALGMALAVLTVKGAPGWLRDLAAAPGTCLLLALLLFLIAATPVGGPKLLDAPTPLESVVKHVLYGGSAAFLLVPAVFAPPGGNAWTRLLSCRPLHLLGLVSYSLFALHLVVLHYTVLHVGGGVFAGHVVAVWVSTVVLSLLVSAVSHVLVERPAIALGRR